MCEKCMDAIKKSLTCETVNIDFKEVGDNGAHLVIRVRDQKLVLESPAEGFILMKYLQMVVGASLIESAIVKQNPELRSILGYEEEVPQTQPNDNLMN